MEVVFYLLLVVTLANIEVGGLSRVVVLDVGGLVLLFPSRGLDVGVVLLAGRSAGAGAVLVALVVEGGGLGRGVRRLGALAGERVALALRLERDVQVLAGALPVAPVDHLVDDGRRRVVARVQLAAVVVGLATHYLLVAAVSRQRFLVT